MIGGFFVSRLSGPWRASSTVPQAPAPSPTFYEAGASSWRKSCPAWRQQAIRSPSFQWSNCVQRPFLVALPGVLGENRRSKPSNHLGRTRRELVLALGCSPLRTSQSCRKYRTALTRKSKDCACGEIQIRRAEYMYNKRAERHGSKGYQVAQVLQVGVRKSLLEVTSLLGARAGMQAPTVTSRTVSTTPKSLP